MALTDSNTYIEPTAGTSLNSARTQFNNSMRSLLTNFRSSAAVSTVNIVSSGVATDVPDGTMMQFANANVNALFISDSTTKKSSHIGGNFTRVGIGHRIENGLPALTSNVSHYDIGELVVTVQEGAAQSASRLYLKTSNTASIGSFLDIGTPGALSIVNTMIATSGVTSDKINLAVRNVKTNDIEIVSTAAGGGGTWFPEVTGVQHAQLAISGIGAASNSAIVLAGSNATSNLSLAFEPNQIGNGSHNQLHHLGLSIVKQNGGYAPIASNVLLQSAILGGTDTPVPLVPAGTIVAMAGAVPAGWLECVGTAISRTTYSELFAILGTTYGAGNGSSTFNIPNFENKVMIGESSSHALGPGAGTFASGGTITTGSTTTTINTTTASASTGVKDAGGLTCVTGVTAAAHTHTAVIPHAVARYIIKT